VTAERVRLTQKSQGGSSEPDRGLREQVEPEWGLREQVEPDLGLREQVEPEWREGEGLIVSSRSLSS
jgi:hypothetical protein